MKSTYKSILKLFFGLFLYSLGIVFTINASLGLSAWDVFHQGLSLKLGITMGKASIFVGLGIVLLNFAFKEKIGWGTIFNMYLIGYFLDFLMINNLVPIYENYILKALMMILGMFTIGIATYFYISAGFGAGPRDGLMIIFTKLTGKSVRFVRNSIEISVLIIGYFLGGFVGVGTAIMAFTIGYFIQFVFKIFNFNINDVKHRYIDDDLRFLKNKFI